jgi:uncharacterized BrkB/YihY/UPF0761 family membrane protein
VLLIATAGVALVGTTIMAGVGSSAGAFGASVGTGVRVLAVVLSVALNTVVLLFTFRIATAHRLTLRDAVPGAITAAVLWQLLQAFGAMFVGQVVKNASVVNAVFAIVLGLIAWIYLAAVALLLSVEINVVRSRSLYPRTLMTPFTDDVDLTEADQRAYSGYARAQRTKDFESIDVAFENDGQNASARRRTRARDP